MINVNRPTMIFICGYCGGEIVVEPHQHRDSRLFEHMLAEHRDLLSADIDVFLPEFEDTMITSDGKFVRDYRIIEDKMCCH